jgi:hypothetical protein
MDEMMMQSRDELVSYLLEPTDEHWKYVWRSAAMPLDETRRP